MRLSIRRYLDLDNLLLSQKFSPERTMFLVWETEVGYDGCAATVTAEQVAPLHTSIFANRYFHAER